MSFEEFLDFMPETVTVCALLSMSVSGVPTYDLLNPTSYSCRIEIGNHLVVDKNNREVTARGIVYLGALVAPEISGLLTLPSTYTVTTPPMITSTPVDDENGPHHVEIHFG